MRDIPGWDGLGSGKYVVVLNASATQLVEANPRRIALIIGPGSGAIVVGPDNNLTTANGMALLTTGSNLVLSRALHGGLVTRAWFARGTAADVSTVVWEAME